MRTRPKKYPVKGEINILELRGNHFKVMPFYRHYLEFPFKTGDQWFTRDLYSGENFNLIHTEKGKWYAVFYSLELNMYILRKLKWLGYIEEVDIRKAYLYYGKKGIKTRKMGKRYS